MFNIGDRVVIKSTAGGLVDRNHIPTVGTQSVVMNVNNTQTGQMVAIDINGIVEWFPDTDLEKV